MSDEMKDYISVTNEVTLRNDDLYVNRIVVETTLDLLDTEGLLGYLKYIEPNSFEKFCDENQIIEVDNDVTATLKRVLELLDLFPYSIEQSQIRRELLSILNR